MNKKELGIVKTLCYSDIFEFPLTFREIAKFNTEEYKTRDELRRHLSNLVVKGVVGKKNNYYYLKGREYLYKVRRERTVYSKEKELIAKKVSKVLGKIPTILLIGISGSLSLKNAKKGDDIDLFIIAKKNTLWITRFFVNIILVAMRVKRARLSCYQASKVCPNMYLTEESLTLPLAKRNLFSAREVVQMKPLINKNDIYDFFLLKNSWLKSFLPNFLEIRDAEYKEKKNILDYFLSFLNDIFYVAQYVYMMKRITNEEVKINVARFHPEDKESYIRSLYSIKLNGYKKLLTVKEEKSKIALVQDTPGY